MFSLEQLLFSVASDVRTNVDILETVLPMLKEVYDREIKERAEIQVSNTNFVLDFFPSFYNVLN